MSTDIHSIWIDSKSILLDMIKEYKLKIKGVFLHSLIIGTTHIIIAYVNVVNSTTFTANQALLLWIQCLIYKFLISLYLESHQTCFYFVIIFDNTLVDSNQQHQTFAAYEMWVIVMLQRNNPISVDDNPDGYVV